MCLSQGLVLVWNGMCGRKKKILVKKKREKGKERTKEEIEWNEKKICSPYS